jgi:hypothetical protein
MRAIIGGLLALWVTAAAAQHADHPRDLALHERFYKTWNQPTVRDKDGKRTSSCCSDKDCYPTIIKHIGQFFYAQRREDQRWLQVPDRILEENADDPRESPDGQSHVCMTPPFADMGDYDLSQPPARGPARPNEIAKDGIVYCATRGTQL